VAGLSAVADAFDGGPPTTLTARLAELLGITSPEDLIRVVYADAQAMPSFAPLVVAAAEAGDWVCTRILKTQANALAQRAGWLATRLDDTTPHIALMGGLAGETYYRECLTEALRRHLPGWRVTRPSRRPVHGALALAEQHAAEQAAQEMESGG
jgi:N-acetylglucosamine kinase-like BadF-type ATPase